MKTKLSILLVIILTFFSVKAQHQVDTFELRIGKYNYKGNLENNKVINNKKIKIPLEQRVLSYSTVNPLTGVEFIKNDTINELELNGIIDSISIKKDSTVLTSDFLFLLNDYEVEICYISYSVYRPIGYPHFSGISSGSISRNAYSTNYLKESPSNSYLIIESICIIPEVGKYISRNINLKLALKILN